MKPCDTCGRRVINTFRYYWNSPYCSWECERAADRVMREMQEASHKKYLEQRRILSKFEDARNDKEIERRAAIYRLRLAGEWKGGEYGRQKL